MRLIPSTISANTPSPGELEIFRRLQAADPVRTADWVVLHSLDIARHVRLVRSEADFVLIIPELGVLVLEVKAHRKIARDPATGLWHLGSDSVTLRSPFKQAEEAMYSLRQAVLRAEPSFENIIFWHAVVFPYVDFTATSGEWHSWQVIDRPRFTRYAFDYLAAAVLADARRFLIETRGWKHLAGSESPTREDCSRLADILRPSFEFYESPKARLSGLEAEVKKYTEEQFDALDHVDANDRVVFQGPAGTGKTLLAIETARRASQRGEKVLLLCFNRLLGAWLRGQTDGTEGITADTLHRFMLRLSGAAVPEGSGQQFWSADLPELALDALITRDDGVADFDLLVIDEAQDILHVPYFDLLDLCVRGGLSSGKWLLFGDFTHQKLYTGGTVTVQELVRRSGAATYRLTDNCRNTPRIASFAHAWSRFEPNYRRVRRPDDGIDPHFVFYRGEAERGTSLVGALEGLYAKGFSNGEIVVLSPLSDVRCAAAVVTDAAWRNRLSTFSRAWAGQVRYGSVHAFKGMEAAAVVVTDLPGVAPAKIQELLYVASTRALHHLTVLADQQRSKELFASLVSGAGT